ncbi:MAG: hypothetical protein ACI857_001008 [Arenicella sp.]|jgi:hypothetical protein
MKKKLLVIGMSAFVLASCGGADESTDSTESNEAADTSATEEVVEDGVINPFPDFPTTGTIAAAGDYVLTPSITWQQDATSGDAESQTFIFYNANMSAPGGEMSTVDFTFDGEVDIPNYMIVPIKSGQTAKNGDIVLTWWQTGSGMQRAIVVDDSNPAEPIVNYIDLDWDNPAQDDGVGIGQATYQIKPNSFHVLTSEWAPGTTVAVKDGASYKAATIISVKGDKVLTCGFAGKMKMHSKSDCTALPVNPNVKVGDMVQAPWVGTFKNVKVEKVDAKMGRVWTEDPFSDDPMVIAYGDVTTGLPIQ